MSKPIVFIGSSTEGLPYAKAVKKAISPYAMAKMWNKNVFELGRIAVESLTKISGEVDFAVFICSPDDVVTSSDNEKTAAPRDNIIFELGFFMSKLGRDRVFFYKPKEPNIKIPSDLLGIIEIIYSIEDRETCESAMRSASKDLVDKLRAFQPRPGRFDEPTVRMKLRRDIEKEVTWEDRIGALGEKTTIHEIRIMNFAATTILAPDYCDYYAAGRNFTDMAKRVRELLDYGICVDMIVNAPVDAVIQDSVNKIRNRRTANDPAEVFLVSYQSIRNSIANDSIYRKAHAEGRFNYALTRVCLPYAIFLVEHKRGYEYLNHVKVDLYPEQLAVEGERPSMVIYQSENPEMYEFFRRNYADVRRGSCVTPEEETQVREFWQTD